MAGTVTRDFDQLLKIIEHRWGFRALRAQQEQAMRAMLEGRDSLTVLPTGGGKSLCYQAPALALGGTTVVLSPLISLMKDQVDSLRQLGVEAAQLDSSLSPDERRNTQARLLAGEIPLLFVSPERVLNSAFQDLLRQIDLRAFAIDEAHCISHWGHDFRPEYRQLNQLQNLFPGVSLHAFTATATEHVRRDIIHQLGLRDPLVLVGNFDRPNLSYRVVARRSVVDQVCEVLDRHADEAGIVYCIRRRDVDELAAALVKQKRNVLPYHAGLAPEERLRIQEAFSSERCDLIVATVAFGMGIDRSNIRFVIHTGMPKSIEHYQQETGRAGRDGLEAECALLYSGQDFLTWRSLIEKSAAEAEAQTGVPAATFVPAALKHLEDMDQYARGAVCRHKALVEYFGQAYVRSGASAAEPAAVELAGDSCQACDICLGLTQAIPDALIVAQKILSAVARTQERFGIGHVISVLRAENTERVRSMGHDKLPTFGALADRPKQQLRDLTYQLISQGVLRVEGTEYPILRLNKNSWEVMTGKRLVRLVEPVRGGKEKKPRAAEEKWEAVDKGLFEALRAMRKKLAEQRGVPPFVIFSDVTLRELARIRPGSLEKMRQIYGIGDAKLRDFGEAVLGVINTATKHGSTNCG